MEFDYRARGLADMLRAAADSGDICPAIVQANYKPPESDAGTWQAWERYGISDYTVVEQGGLRVAVFGVLGVDADECAPMSGMEFEPIAGAAKRVVAEIQAEADADFVICLSTAAPTRKERERTTRWQRRSPASTSSSPGTPTPQHRRPFRQVAHRSSPAASIPRTSGRLPSAGAERRGGDGRGLSPDPRR